MAYDWQAIERDYRAGQLSYREIGKAHGLSESMVRKRAKAEGWTRDLSRRVRQATKTKLVRVARPEAQPKPRMSPKEQEAYDSEIVEHAAGVATEVVLGHRKLITRLMETGELLIEKIHDKLGPDQKYEVKDLKSISSTFNDAVAATQRAISLERQAFNIDDDNGEGTGGTIKLPGLTILIDGDRDAG